MNPPILDFFSIYTSYKKLPISKDNCLLFWKRSYVLMRTANFLFAIVNFKKDKSQ